MFAHAFDYVLPAHKADELFASSDVVIEERANQLNPRPPFLRYLALRDEKFPFHLALFLTSSESVPTRSWYLSRLHVVVSDNVAGHSLRAGGATFFAVVGWSDDRIQALGCWTSAAFKRYIRKNPVLLNALIHGRNLALPQPRV